ncbi:PREDICTED: natural cytotoxicity triggering receptor 3 [Chinchilla lanigera]|uniref:natural cytotoxicity triggering receptor 3 n=1 Tax=Chinchilla lanigera TaxID=34839 RepID=UPI000695FC4A|nr:PREDICTED: natural cytotoxicity triggering receptor 3 [Chinchilla lanigera]
MAWPLLLIFIAVHPASCDLWVSQAPEVHTQEGVAAHLPCSFNTSRGGLAIGFVTWYRDKVAPGNEVKNETPAFRGRLAPLPASRFLLEHQADLQIRAARARDAGVYVCRVEVLGLGVGTGSGTRLLVGPGSEGAWHPGPGGGDPWPARATSRAPAPAHPAARPTLLLRAGLFALGFLSVALGSVLCLQGRGHRPRGTHRRATPPTASEK